MMRRHFLALVFASGMAAAALAAAHLVTSDRALAFQGRDAAATDWPQWRGPDRNGLSTEKGLLQQWPSSGPPQVWSVSSLGAGYGSIAIAGERIFVQGARNRQSIVSVL